MGATMRVYDDRNTALVKTALMLALASVKAKVGPLTEADASDILKLLEWMDEDPLFRWRLVDGASEKVMPKVFPGLKGPA
jgi:hypothetical protein